MTLDELYLDNAATSAMRPAAREAMVAFVATPHGNASGQHRRSRVSRNALEAARERAAVLIGADRPGEVLFTSGGTEADNLAVTGAAAAHPDAMVVVSAFEHKAVLQPAHRSAPGAIRLVPPSSSGVVSPSDVSDAVQGRDVVVSIMAANNEIGVIQPIDDIGRAVEAAARTSFIHTDAVQHFVGRDVDVASMPVDALSLSAHKFGGPTGVGLLYVRSGSSIEPLIIGGGQEAGMRAGTSNVAGIVGMVAAMEDVVASRDDFAARVGAERDTFEATLAALVPDVVFTGSGEERLDHFSHVRIPGIRAESLLIRLDDAGVMAAAGSSCQSGAAEPSHVLAALGMSEDEARACLRFTFGWDSPSGAGVAAAERIAGEVGAMR